MDSATVESTTFLFTTEESHHNGDNRGDTGVFWAGLASMLVFYVAILLVGTVASWLKKSFKGTSDDMMLAGRDIGLFVGIFTMTSSWVGGGFVNGSAEHVATPGYGLAWCQAPFCYCMSFIVGGLFFAKKMRNGRYTTILDPFQEKYGAVMTAFIYIPALLGDLLWSAQILSALGLSLTVVIGLNHTYSVIVSGAVAVLYTLVGGLYSVSFTDVIQLICMFVGLYLTLPFALTHEAVTPIKETAFEINGWLGTLTWDRSMGLWFDICLMIILGGIPWQVYYQRVLSQKTARNAQILSFAASFGCLIMVVPPVLIGAVASSTDWNKTGFPDGIESDYSLAVPLVMRYLTPTLVGIIGLGAVSAAVMSSADSCILSASSMFARNVYKPLRNTFATYCRPRRKLMKTSDAEVVWVMRAAILVTGSAACGIAITVTSIYELFLLCSDFPYVILFPQLTCVLFLSFANTYGAVAGYILGLLLRLVGGEAAMGWSALVKYPWYDEETGIQYFPFKAVAMLSNLLAIVIVSYTTNVLFKKKILPASADVFRCFVDNCKDDKKQVPLGEGYDAPKETEA